jgi:hypothetical protein
MNALIASLTSASPVPVSSRYALIASIFRVGSPASCLTQSDSGKHEATKLSAESASRHSIRAVPKLPTLFVKMYAIGTMLDSLMQFLFLTR